MATASERVAPDFLKNKDTWCKMLWRKDAELDTARRVFNGQWCRGYFAHFRLAESESQPLRVVRLLGWWRVGVELQLCWQQLQLQLSAGRSSQLSLFFPSQDGFYFIAFIHPPSILPASSSFSEIEMYLLLSRDFISQATCKKNFSKSSFDEARFK